MRKDHNLHVVWGVTLVAVLDTSSVTPAFPRIVQELGISPGQVVLLITYLPILMNEFFRAAPFVIGVVVASLSLTTALTSTQIERLSSRLSEKGLIRFSFLLYAVALCLVPLAPTVVFRIAQSLNLPNSFSLLTAAAPKENRGAFLALNSTILRLGQTIGPLCMSVRASALAAPTSSPPHSPSPCRSSP